MSRLLSSRIVALYSNIGRGHPNYLDSLLRSMHNLPDFIPEQLVVTDVFAQSSGLSLTFWKMLRRLYRSGGKGGLISHLYNALRRRAKAHPRKGLVPSILGHSLRKNLGRHQGLIVVDHPLVSQLLGQSCRVHYLHGEIAAPAEFDYLSAEKIYVPLLYTAERIGGLGISTEKLFITGLMLEPELAGRGDMLSAMRRERMLRGDQITVGFFNSGAYPKAHLVGILESCEFLLEQLAGRAILSTGTDPTMIRLFQSRLGKYNPTEAKDDFLKGRSLLLLLSAREREQLTLREIEILRHLDLAVFAAHERINWTLGLNLPTILLEPHFGSFARENFEFAKKHGVIYHSPSGRARDALQIYCRDYIDRHVRTAALESGFATDGADVAARAIWQAAQES